MESDSEPAASTPAPPDEAGESGSPRPATADASGLDDVELLDLSQEPCGPSYAERSHEILTDLGVEISPSAPNLPPVSELQKRTYSYRINVAKTWMPEIKRKQLDTKFDLYRHELVLLAQQEERGKYKPGMTDEEKKASDAPTNRRLASDLQRLMNKKLELAINWLPSQTRRNLENDTIILRDQIVRENEMAKMEASAAAAGMSDEERELEERIMVHKLHVAEAWMPKEVLEKLNHRFTSFQVTSAMDEQKKAGDDIRAGMSPDDRRIQAMIRHQQYVLRVQQANLNRLQVAESWIPEEERLKIENEYSMMRARHWRKREGERLPGQWGAWKAKTESPKRRKAKRITGVNKNPMVKMWRKKISSSPDWPRRVIDLMPDEDGGTCPKQGNKEAARLKLLQEEQERLREIDREQAQLAEEEREFLRQRNERLAEEAGGATGLSTAEQTAEEARLAKEEEEFLEMEKIVAEEFEKEVLKREKQLQERSMRQEAESPKPKEGQPAAAAAAAPAAAAAAEADQPEGAEGGAAESCSETTLSDKQEALRELQDQLERLQHGDISEEEVEKMIRDERMLAGELERHRASGLHRTARVTCPANRLAIPAPPPPAQTRPAGAEAETPSTTPTAAPGSGARPKTRSIPCSRLRTPLPALRAVKEVLQSYQTESNIPQSCPFRPRPSRPEQRPYNFGLPPSCLPGPSGGQQGGGVLSTHRPRALGVISTESSPGYSVGQQPATCPMQRQSPAMTGMPGQQPATCPMRRQAPAGMVGQQRATCPMRNQPSSSSYLVARRPANYPGMGTAGSSSYGSHLGGRGMSSTTTPDYSQQPFRLPQQRRNQMSGSNTCKLPQRRRP
ncbi:golgin subfamily A member 6-like protein 22 isoform X2 [Scyliorhinus canicula]|uniref:golgin subfamily A member 6-like protein 22 isoform X2 n=1 Tax=Scyliorhinus canicula TaxID=7830 RepID=UPI0018F4EBE5|nr:golgin subfamily A member 6-like protein 22 isoform X2 [Scyliorhinus canicula]